MIQGEVNEDFEAIVTLRLHGPKGDFEDVTVIVDTGFTGTLVINDAVVKALQLNQKRRFGTAILADGSGIHFQQYEVVLDWMGSRKKVQASAIDHDFLIGMKLLAGHELFVDVRPGGKVEIR